MIQRCIIYIALYFCITTNTFAGVNNTIYLNYDVTSPKREVRAVWLTTIGGLDWPRSYAHTTSSIERQKQELIDILDKYYNAGINTVLLQTRVRATMIYPSSIEPWDGCMSGVPGKSPGYDPLLFAIDECHKRGMELHAWVVTIPVGKWNTLGCKQLRKTHPAMIKKIGPDGYMDPENNETSEYLADICGEIARRYDVDGIHLDYIRYPENWPSKLNRTTGRNNISKIARRITNTVRAIKPWIKMSCSPIGKHNDVSRYWSHGWNAYEKVCQEAQNWLQDGTMDILFPMMYFKDNQFFPFAIDWQENSHGKIVAPGLGIYFMSPHEGNWSFETIKNEMFVLRQLNMGHAYYRSKFFTDDTKGLYTFASEQFDNTLALVPAMSWINNKAPGCPQQLRTDSTTATLSWRQATNNNDSPYLTYNVYASDTYPVDINKASNIMIQRYEKNIISIDMSANLYYAVTAMDRYGNESEPVQNIKIAEHRKPLSTEGVLTCREGSLTLPYTYEEDINGFVTIETMQGNIIAVTKPYNRHIMTKNIPDGFYVLRSLNKKGDGHRLGFFYKKDNK